MTTPEVTKVADLNDNDLRLEVEALRTWERNRKAAHADKAMLARVRSRISDIAREQARREAEWQDTSQRQSSRMNRAGSSGSTAAPTKKGASDMATSTTTKATPRKPAASRKAAAKPATPKAGTAKVMTAKANAKAPKANGNGNGKADAGGTKYHYGDWQKAYGKAQRVAVAALKAKHQAEYDRLLEQARDGKLS